MYRPDFSQTRASFLFLATIAIAYLSGRVLSSAVIETYILPKTNKIFLLVLIPGYKNVNNERDQAYR